MVATSAFLSWLLASSTPTIRYLALTRLADPAPDVSQAESAWQQIPLTGPVPILLAGQTALGNWNVDRSYYTPKYTSTHWSMLLLAEFSAGQPSEQARLGADFMLSATAKELKGPPDSWDCGLACFWGNLLRYALLSGVGEDPRLARVVDYLQREAANQWTCSYNYGQPCAWGAARGLWGLAAIPPAQRTPAIEKALDSGLRFLLEEHDLRAADYPPREERSRLWHRLNFPLFYQADILFVLRLLGELDALDHPGAAPALDWLAAKRLANGRWRGSSPYRNRTWKDLAPTSETDRWVSLQAALLLKQAQRA